MDSLQAQSNKYKFPAGKSARCCGARAPEARSHKICSWLSVLITRLVFHNRFGNPFAWWLRTQIAATNQGQLHPWNLFNLKCSSSKFWTSLHLSLKKISTDDSIEREVLVKQKYAHRKESVPCLSHGWSFLPKYGLTKVSNWSQSLLKVIETLLVHSNNYRSKSILLFLLMVDWST